MQRAKPLKEVGLPGAFYEISKMAGWKATISNCGLKNAFYQSKARGFCVQTLCVQYV